jgi:hypothetical protein
MARYGAIWRNYGAIMNYGAHFVRMLSDLSIFCPICPDFGAYHGAYGAYYGAYGAIMARYGAILLP